MLAVFAEQPEAALYLIKSGEAQVDLVDKVINRSQKMRSKPTFLCLFVQFGWSALMFGAHAGNINLVRMLLSNGANVNFVNKVKRKSQKTNYANYFFLIE